jgi:histidinol-phosphatase
MIPSIEEELDLALRLADVADAITLPRYRSADLRVDQKPDRTPVTEADQAAERAIRSLLAEARPDHAMLGEEFGLSGHDTEWQWVIDPIDGTMNYIRGIPVWATLIGFVHRNRPVVGVVSAPSLHRRWWGGFGIGAFVNGERIRVSQVRSLEDAQLSFNALRDFEEHGGHEAMTALVGRVWRVRGFGDFWSHMLVAEGGVDIAVEAIVKPWDMAAVQIIVEEAGGRFSDLSGAPDYSAGSALSSNGLLHDEVLAAFVEGADPSVP